MVVPRQPRFLQDGKRFLIQSAERSAGNHIKIISYFPYCLSDGLDLIKSKPVPACDDAELLGTVSLGFFCRTYYFLFAFKGILGDVGIVMRGLRAEFTILAASAGLGIDDAAEFDVRADILAPHLAGLKNKPIKRHVQDFIDFRRVHIVNNCIIFGLQLQ